MRHIKTINEFDLQKEGKAHDVVKKEHSKKPWDPQKKDEFRIKVKNHVKSLECTTKQVGNDLEIICNDEMVAQVMFRDSYVGVRPTGNKFTDEFGYDELGKIRSNITGVIKKCKNC